MDREVNSALIRLLDTLCEFERMSSRGSTLVLIPHNSDELVVVAQDGKPVPKLSVALAVELAFRLRDKKFED